MMVRCVDNRECPELKKGKKYKVSQCIIGGFHTEVYLEDFNRAFNSGCFDNKFQKKLDEAIDYFRKNHDDHDTYQYGVFIRDF